MLVDGRRCAAGLPDASTLVSGRATVQLRGLRQTYVTPASAFCSFELGIHPRVVHIMEIVGHSALEMTMNVNGHVNLTAKRTALDQLDTELS